MLLKEDGVSSEGRFPIVDVAETARGRGIPSANDRFSYLARMKRSSCPFRSDSSNEVGGLESI